MHDQTALWQPTESFIKDSNLKAFERWLQQEKGLTFDTYHDLWEWSVTNVAAFWESVWQYFDIMAHSPYKAVLGNTEMPGTTWFEGATLNYAEHIFRQQSDARPAILFQSERVKHQEISWAELSQKVAAVQRYLLAKGIKKGDRVAAYLPNIPEAIVCFLAVNGLGAIWTCCSPDFGVRTVIERFEQVAPRLLLAVDGYQYNGKPYDRMAEVAEIQASLPSVEETILLPYLNESVGAPNAQTVLWASTLAAYEDTQEPIFTPVPFDHPIWVLYSSGTTGKPKAITHSHGGVLLEHLKYMAFHNDAKAGEHFFWFTTTGWMMWNFLQASMLVGAVPVLYEGSPGYPSLDVLWQTAAQLPIHHFGTSAPYLVACMKKGLSPKSFGLEHLRSIGSTGAPLPPEAFEWVYQDVSETVWLCSMSGGTDVCTAFVGGCPYEPVYKGAIQGRALGCALYAYDDDAQPITGSLGEMVIEQPMPSMPVFFWNDPDGSRYAASYFEHYPGKWRHGDWIKLFANGSLIIQGRSDATLNRKGIRIGTAEIYNVLDGIGELKDSIILNLEKEGGDDIMPLFVVLQEGQPLDESLQKKIKQELRSKCSPRHVPDTIIVVPDVPYTLSGKKMEVPVKKILMGMDGTKSLNKDATRNPEAVQFFIDYADRFKEEYL
jgi:acetoacetyl-CoA synthetase